MDSVAVECLVWCSRSWFARWMHELVLFQPAVMSWGGLSHCWRLRATCTVWDWEEDEGISEDEEGGEQRGKSNARMPPLTFTRPVSWHSLSSLISHIYSCNLSSLIACPSHSPPAYLFSQHPKNLFSPSHPPSLCFSLFLQALSCKKLMWFPACILNKDGYAIA